MRIPNWKKFQHYKHRKPPWIRLYRELLEDPDWMNQSDAAKSMLCELWMVASDTEDGSLPAIDALAWRLRRTSEAVMSALSEINVKFLDGASDLLADCKRDAPSEKRRVTEQSRGETEQARESIHGACNRLTKDSPDIPAIDRLDEDLAFEEVRFRDLAIAAGRDNIQAVLDSLPRPTTRAPFSASRWLATGRTGIPRDERALTALRLTCDALEARARAQGAVHLSDSNRETLENIRRVGERMKAKEAQTNKPKEITG